jgi:hypothetical protein
MGVSVGGIVAVAVAVGRAVAVGAIVARAVCVAVGEGCKVGLGVGAAGSAHETASVATVSVRRREDLRKVMSPVAAENGSRDVYGTQAGARYPPAPLVSALAPLPSLFIV